MAKRFLKPLTFEGGMTFSESDAAYLPDGAAEILANWVPGRDGGLRVRSDWFRGTQTGTAPTEIESIFFSPLAGDLGGVFTAEKTVNAGPSNDIEIRRAPNYSSPSWSLVDTLAGASGGSYNHHVPFVAANGIVLYGNTSFPNDRLRFWNGTTAADASTVAVAGHTLAFHKERFWAGGTDANPSRLYYSAIQDHTSWDLNNYIDIGGNDGGKIVDIAQALGGLLVAKSTALYFMTGDGPSNFAITPLDAGEAAVGRTICSTPKGIIIAGTSGIYFWSGGHVERVPYLYTYVDPSTLFPAYTVNRGPHVYIGSKFQNAIECFNLETGARWIEFTNEPSSPSSTPDLFHFDGVDYISVMTTAGFAAGWDQNAIVGGGRNGATVPGVSYREGVSPGSTLDLDFDEGFFVRKKHLVLGDAGKPATLLHMHIMFLKDVGPAQADADLTISIANELGTTQTVTVPSESRDRYRADFGLTGYEFDIQFEQHLDVSASLGFDFPRILLEYEVEEVR